MQKKTQVEQLKSVEALENGEVFHVEENEQGQKKEETMAEKEKSDEPNDCRV